MRKFVTDGRGNFARASVLPGGTTLDGNGPSSLPGSLLNNLQYVICVNVVDLLLVSLVMLIRDCLSIY